MNAEHSFEIRSAHGFFDKLKEEYKDLRDDLTSSRHAINCAMTAWHLTEWVWAEHLAGDPPAQQRIDGSIRKFYQFRNWAVVECPELEIMECITNGSKHFTFDKEKVQSTKKHGGGFGPGFARDFDIGRLEVELDDGTRRWFDNVVEAVIEFWDKFFVKYLTY